MPRNMLQIGNCIFKAQQRAARPRTRLKLRGAAHAVSPLSQSISAPVPCFYPPRREQQGGKKEDTEGVFYDSGLLHYSMSAGGAGRSSSGLTGPNSLGFNARAVTRTSSMRPVKMDVMS